MQKPYTISTYLNDIGIERRQLQIFPTELYINMRECINIITQINESLVLQFFKDHFFQLSDEGSILRYCWMLFADAGAILETEELNTVPTIISKLFELADNNNNMESFNPIILVNIILASSQYDKMLQKNLDILKFIISQIFKVLQTISNYGNNLEIECLCLYSLRTIVIRCKNLK